MAETMRGRLQSCVKSMLLGTPRLKNSALVTTSSSVRCIDCWKEVQGHPNFGRGFFSSAQNWKKIDKINSSDFMKDRNSLGLSDKMFGMYEKVSPAQVSEKLVVSEGIKKPDYCSRPDGTPSKPISRKPGIKTKDEIEIMKESCRLAKFVLERTLIEAKPGISTDDLDKYAHELITKHDAYPSALGYRKFPKSICASVNNVACHGIPDERKLISGDIISLDVMVFKNGFHGDCAGTALVGNVDELGKKLVRVAEECTNIGIKACGPNVPLENIGKVIESHAASEGLSVVPMFTGHGVGRNIHERPDIYHYDRPGGQKDAMKPGMVFTIEPVITQGMELVMVLSDGWTAVTVDGARTAQFEHTILITEDGAEILTDCSFATIF